MDSTRHRVFVILVGVLLLLGCSPSPNSTATIGTPYTRLDLETPESAAAEFSEAFKLGDYFTVYLILSPEAQTGFATSIRQLSIGGFVSEDLLDSWSGADWLRYPQDDPGAIEHQPTLWVMWADLMHHADIKGGHLLSFDSEMTIDSVDQAGKSEWNLPVTQIVMAQEDGGKLVFRLVQSADLRWRVDQVSDEGSLITPSDQLISTSEDPLGPRQVDSPSNAAYEDLNLSTPELAVSEFLRANIRSDYLTTQLIFSPEAQEFVLKAAFTPHLKSFVTSEVTGRLNKPTVPGQPLTYQSAFFQFERALLLADELDAHTIEMRKEFEVVSVDLAGTGAEVVVEQEGASAITFHLLQAPSGKWRVHRILSTDSEPVEEPIDGAVYVLGPVNE